MWLWVRELCTYALLRSGYEPLRILLLPVMMPQPGSTPQLVAQSRVIAKKQTNKQTKTHPQKPKDFTES